jgi:cell division protein FtsB
MREFQARKKQQASINRILSSKWTLIIALIVIAILIRGNIRIFKNYFHVKDKYNQDIEFYQSLKNREVELNKDIDRLETDQGIDYEIRKKLDVSKDDEKVIKIIDKR